MKNPFRGKLVNIVLISVLVSGWGIIHLYPLPYWRMLILDIPLWLIIGTLMWHGNHISSLLAKLSISDFMIGFVLSWGLMIFLIFLPAWFPILIKNKFGIEINLQNSPVVLIASINFLLGYCMRVTLKIPHTGWQQAKASLKNRPTCWKGFKDLLRFSLGVRPQSLHR